MMGRLSHDQEQFFYSFRLDEAVPEDHAVREIAAVLDLSWAHSELAPYYPEIGRPSIDPVQSANPDFFIAHLDVAMAAERPEVLGLWRDFVLPRSRRLICGAHRWQTLARSTCSSGFFQTAKPLNYKYMFDLQIKSNPRPYGSICQSLNVKVVQHIVAIG